MGKLLAEGRRKDRVLSELERRKRGRGGDGKFCASNSTQRNRLLLRLESNFKLDNRKKTSDERERGLC